MSEFVPALAEYNDAKQRREPLADVGDPFKGFQPVPGFTRTDLAKKQFAKDLATTVRTQPRVKRSAPRQRCQLGTTSGDSHVDVRKFHNSIKNAVYKLGFSYAGLENNPRVRFPTLLELSCGRGGDMFKWNNNGYRNVVAVDTDADALDEARSRFKNSDTGPLRTRYEQMDLTKGDLVAQLVSKRLGTMYDTVSIQFAIQYMCGIDVLPTFLQNVATLIKPGGTFIGTYPCGAEIAKLLGKESHFDNGFLKITENTHGPGIQFYADFSGNSKSYFDEFGTSQEFPVSFPTIIEILEPLGFVLVENKGFCDTQEFNRYILTAPEKQFSGVFKTFVFQKRELTAFFPPAHGINWDSLKIDKVGKFSITRPRDAAVLHKAIREFVDSDTHTVCDGTACVGGDTIHFSSAFREVFAWEVDTERFRALKNNINIYGIKNVTTINGSIVNSTGECDLLYLDPPWGGPEYKNNGAVELYLDGQNIKTLLVSLKKRFRQIAIKVPFNYNMPVGSQFVKKISEKINVWFVR